MKTEDSGFQRKSKRLGSGRSTRKLGKEEGEVSEDSEFQMQAGNQLRAGRGVCRGLSSGQRA